MLLCWRDSLFGSMLLLLCFLSSKGGKNSTAFGGMVGLFIVVVLRVQILALEGSAWLTVIMRNMMVGIAPVAAAWARARMGAWARRRPWTGATPFSGQSVRAQWRGLVIVHDLFVLLLEVIGFAIISCRTFSCCPSPCNKSDCGVNRLDGNCHIVVCCNRIGCFDGSCSSCNIAASIWSHFCKQWEDELSSSLLAAFSPWACQRCRPLYWQFDTAQKRLWAKEGPWAPFVCFCKLVLMCFGLCKKDLFVLLSHCGQLGYSRHWDSWRAALNAAWIHALAWMWASWQCKANKLVGPQYSGARKLPQGNPWYTWRSFPLWDGYHCGHAYWQRLSTWYDLRPNPTNPSG